MRNGRPVRAPARRLQAMAGFLDGKNLGANQIEFVNHLTDLGPRGPESLFSQASVDELISVLHTARRTATAA